MPHKKPVKVEVEEHDTFFCQLCEPEVAFEVWWALERAAMRL